MFFNLFKKSPSSSDSQSPVSPPSADSILPVHTISPVRPSYFPDSPLLTLSESELRDVCRHRIDAFESWSRRLIDETLKSAYAADYFDFMISESQPLVKQEIKRRIESRIQANPKRFPRKVDAFLLEDIEYFLCRDDLYKNHFKHVLEPFYSGIYETRKVLERLILIRNKLSHGNTISIHEAEQCLCYTSDFIEVYKEYYSKIGKERDYNVPTFTRIKDIFGNDIVREDSIGSWEMHCYGRTAPKIQLRSGDYYKLWVEVDGSFDPSTYNIKWVVIQDFDNVIARGTGNTVEFRVGVQNVSCCPKIRITITSKKSWHRFHDSDDYIIMDLEDVLPPIEDTY